MTDQAEHHKNHGCRQTAFGWHQEGGCPDGNQAEQNEDTRHTMRHSISESDREIKYKIVGILDHAEEVSKKTEGLADEAYIAHREVIIDGVMQLIAEARREQATKLLPDFYIRYKTADGTQVEFEGKEAVDLFIESLSTAEAHKGYEPSTDLVDEYLKRICCISSYLSAGMGAVQYAAKEMAAWHQADVDRAVLEARLEELNNVEYKLPSVTSRYIKARIAKLTPPHNPTQSDWREQQNIYRDRTGKLMCSGCNGEVFGGICDCMPDDNPTQEEQ